MYLSGRALAYPGKALGSMPSKAKKKKNNSRLVSVDSDNDS
jgi:hypothetical protein